MTSDDSGKLTIDYGILKEDPRKVELVGLVPIEELEALADAWEHNGITHDASQHWKDKCAQELREVIEDYE
jgi:hypothetical protein